MHTNNHEWRTLIGMTEILLKDEVHRIIGCAFGVYNDLGAVFLEPIYQEAFERELAEQKIPFEAQKRLQIFFKGAPLINYLKPPTSGSDF